VLLLSAITNSSSAKKDLSVGIPRGNRFCRYRRLQIQSLQAAPDTHKIIRDSLPDLRSRFKYLDCLPDIIQKPDEIWQREVKSKQRSFFVKVLDNNVVLVFEQMEGHYEYFNLMIYRDLDNIRKGALRYNKSLP